MITGESIAGSAVAEPAQPQHRLPETRQRPASPGSATPVALCEQQFRREPGQFSGDVE